MELIFKGNIKELRELMPNPMVADGKEIIEINGDDRKENRNKILKECARRLMSNCTVHLKECGGCSGCIFWLGKDNYCALNTTKPHGWYVVLS